MTELNLPVKLNSPTENLRICREDVIELSESYNQILKGWLVKAGHIVELSTGGVCYVSYDAMTSKDLISYFVSPSSLCDDFKDFLNNDIKIDSKINGLRAIIANEYDNCDLKFAADKKSLKDSISSQIDNDYQATLKSYNNSYGLFLEAPIEETEYAGNLLNNTHVEV